jgi:mono/diheme cytochrome c family protein
MSRSLVCLSVVLAAVAACYTGGGIDNPSPTPGAGAGNVGTAGFDITGLPCDVAAMLAASCASCHGATPSGGAPNPITSYEQLTAPSLSDPSLTVAQLSLQRMKDAKAPMPPGGAAAADIAVLEGWITASQPRGTCTTPVAGNGVYNGPTVCTSNKHWTGGNHGSSSMHPGGECINCHASGEGPRYAIAGTVYPTAHEPDDCYGSAGAITVEITDANGVVSNLSVNSAGNFYAGGGKRGATIAMPYKAKVISGGKSRVMVGAQTNGDCNSCHSTGGSSGAPGRIIAP